MPDDEATPSDAPPAEAPSPKRDKDKKERVLHTRIPAVLEDELKAAAEALRVPVSNLVRTILEDAVAIADRATGKVEDRLQRAARSVQSERERLKRRMQDAPASDAVIAYQPVVVARASHCTRCDCELEPGADAALVVTSRGVSKNFVCKSCMADPPADD